MKPWAMDSDALSYGFFSKQTFRSSFILAAKPFLSSYLLFVYYICKTFSKLI